MPALPIAMSAPHAASVFRTSVAGPAPRFARLAGAGRSAGVRRVRAAQLAHARADAGLLRRAAPAAGQLETCGDALQQRAQVPRQRLRQQLQQLLLRLILRSMRRACGAHFLPLLMNALPR